MGCRQPKDYTPWLKKSLLFSLNKIFNAFFYVIAVIAASACLHSLTFKTKVMKSLFLCSCIFLSVSAFTQYTYKNLDIKFNLNETEQKNYTHQNLRLYPIKARQSFTDTFKTVGKYMSLKEALAKGKVIITEQIGGAQVNTLTIENISSDTVMVMSGEVITGGKQNRIIGKDLILLPHSGKIDLSVYCVEAGRWETVSSGGGNFNAYYSVGSLSLRKTVDKSQNQSAVWSNVDAINAANSTSSSTKTYTAISKSIDFNNKLKTYTDFFKEKFSAEKDVIGVVVVSGNKVLGCDMFATPDLFKKNFENLLASYATEAIVNGSAVTASSETVKTYMDKLLKSEEQQSATIKEKGKVFVNDGKKMRVSSYE